VMTWRCAAFTGWASDGCSLSFAELAAPKISATPQALPLHESAEQALYFTN
jgi:hypothetical protein